MSCITLDKCKKWLQVHAERQRYEKEEQVRDIMYEDYYTRNALDHLNHVISTFGRRPQRSLENAMHYARNLGILQPYSDDILYMQNMKKTSLIKRL